MNNRQGGGRRRGRNNNNNGGRPQGNGRGGDQGNRIDSRARGNAAQLLEKYKNMARDAQMSGDRVMTEYYLQFADHYYRVLADTRSRQEEQRARFGDRDDEREPQSQDGGDEADDMDDMDPIDMIGRAPRNRDHQRDGNRDGNREQGRDGQRDGNRRDFNGNREQGRDGQREGGQRERNRDDRPRDDRPREERNRDEQPRREREPRTDAGDASEGGDRARLQRRERPARREPRDDARDDSPIGIDLAVLPPAIGIETPVASNDAASDEAAPAPKRRGRPRKAVSEGEGEDAAA